MPPNHAVECQVLPSNQKCTASPNSDSHSEHGHVAAFACSVARPDGEPQQQQKHAFSLLVSASVDSQPVISLST
eukprot:6968104-Pyramimonas_sp.AAC.1